MTAAEAFNVLYVLLIEWMQAGVEVDVGRVDDLLDGWDPEAEERVARAVERRFRGAVG